MRCKRQARSESSSRVGLEQLCASPFNLLFLREYCSSCASSYSGKRLPTQDLRRQIKAPATTFRSTHLECFSNVAELTKNHLANWIDYKCRHKTKNATVELGRPVSRGGHIANLTYRRKRRITLEKATASQPDYERKSPSSGCRRPPPIRISNLWKTWNWKFCYTMRAHSSSNA